MEPGLNVLLSYTLRHPEDVAGLDQLAGYPIQLGINTLDQAVIDAASEAIKRNNIHLESVHLRRIGPDNVRSVLGEMTEKFGCRSYALHADKRTPEDAKYAWMEPLEDLAVQGITVGFENGRKTGSWLKNPYDLPREPNFNLVLDLGHLPEGMEPCAVMADMQDQLLGIHIAENDHSPYFHFDKLLPFMIQNPNKEYVLEYSRDYLPVAKQDFAAIKELYAEYCAETATR